MFNERLREERKRLKFNQTEFGNACGVTKQAQLRYEKGERKPDSEYVEKAGSLGVDVNYLFTGRRSQSVDLPTDEAFLLDSFRALNAEQKKMALQFLIGGFDGLHEGKNIKHSVVNSPNASVVHNQSGFTEFPFLIATTICGLMAWALGTMANIKAMTDMLMSMAFGIPAVILWVITLILAVFGHYAGKKSAIKDV